MGVPHHHVSVPTFISLHFFSEHPQNMFCCIAFFLFTFSSSEIWRLFRLRRQPKKKHLINIPKQKKFYAIYSVYYFKKSILSTHKTTEYVLSNSQVNSFPFSIYF